MPSGRHRRDVAVGCGGGEAAAPGPRPRARVPRRARARVGGGAGAADRRGRRIELHVPARARRGLFVLRRPPRPPLPPSAHDVVREARLQLAIGKAGFARLPEIVAVCEDESGARRPVLRHDVPRGLGRDRGAAARARGRGGAAAPRRRPGGRARRDPRGGRLDSGAGRVRAAGELRGAAGAALHAALGGEQDARAPRVEEVGAWLATHVPEPLPDTVVHGDYRLGNTMVAPGEPSRIVAVLDWEMGAIGDPRADLGYLLAMYTEPGGRASPLGASPVTAEAGFPSKARARGALRARKRARGRVARVVRGPGAVEGGRLLRGDLRPVRPRRARRRGRERGQVRAGVPALAEAAAEAIARERGNVRNGSRV